MQIEQHSAAVAGRQEPAPNLRGPVSRGPTGESGDLDNMPHVLARIPSLASEPLDDETEGASPSRLWSSRASLKILAAVGGALFLLALWGFVFDRNKSKDEADAPIAGKEPFRPEVPAPNAPEAPRWAGLPSGSEPRPGEAKGPISAEARPGPVEMSAAGGGPWMGPGQPTADRSPVPWTLSEQSTSPASPAWSAQAMGRSEPVPDWTTQPYPSTADRSKPPVWDMAAGPGQLSAPDESGRGVGASDAPPSARAAVNPIYRDDRDPSGTAPAAYTGPASAGQRETAGYVSPPDPGQGLPGASNRPVSLAQRPPLDRQLPAAAAPSQDFRNPGEANWNRPADPRSAPTPAARIQGPSDLREGPGGGQETFSPFRSPSPSDYRSPSFGNAPGTQAGGAAGTYGASPHGYLAPSYPGAGTAYGPRPGATSQPTMPYGVAPGSSNSAAGVGSGTGSAPAGGVPLGASGTLNDPRYGAMPSAPVASPTPRSNPYHNLLPMYQAPAGNQPASLPAQPAGGYRYGSPQASGYAGGLGPSTAGPGGPGANYSPWSPASAGQGGGSYGPASLPPRGSVPATGGVAYPPSYSLPITR